MDFSDLWSTPAGSESVWNRRQRVGGAWSGGYYGGASGDRTLDAIRNAAMADALGGISSARYGAQTTSPNDPSLAASAGLRALLGGQGRAARGMLGVTSDYLRQRQMQKWQEHMARLQAGNPVWGAVGDIGGALLGAWL